MGNFLDSTVSSNHVNFPVSVCTYSLYLLLYLLWGRVEGEGVLRGKEVEGGGRQRARRTRTRRGLSLGAPAQPIRPRSMMTLEGDSRGTFHSRWRHLIEIYCICWTKSDARSLQRYATSFILKLHFDVVLALYITKQLHKHMFYNAPTAGFQNPFTSSIRVDGGHTHFPSVFWARGKCINFECVKI